MSGQVRAVTMLHHRTRPDVRGQTGITLIELLVSMAVLGIITAMIITVWIGLQASYASTSRASQAREAARDGVARMTMEIRDAQASGTSNAITEAGRFTIVFYSTFNAAGNDVVDSAPRQTAFVYDASGSASGGTIYRVVDTDTIANGVTDELADPAQYGRPIVENVVNWSQADSVNLTPRTSIFRYSFYDGDGVYRTVSPMTQSTALIRAVQIRVQVDLNPGKSPVYMDLKTTAQPRNMRPST